MRRWSAIFFLCSLLLQFSSLTVAENQFSGPNKNIRPMVEMTFCSCQFLGILTCIFGSFTLGHTSVNVCIIKNFQLSSLSRIIFPIKTIIDITDGTKTGPQETDYQDGFLRLVTLTKDIEITVAFMLDDHRLTLIICFVGPLKPVLKGILVSIRLKLKNILGRLYKIKCKHFEMGSGCWACCHFYIRIHPFSHCLCHRQGYSFHQGTKKCIVKRSTNIL